MQKLSSGPGCHLADRQESRSSGCRVRPFESGLHLSGLIFLCCPFRILMPQSNRDVLQVCPRFPISAPTLHGNLGFLLLRRFPQEQGTCQGFGPYAGITDGRGRGRDPAVGPVRGVLASVWVWGITPSGSEVLGEADSREQCLIEFQKGNSDFLLWITYSVPPTALLWTISFN